MGGELILINRVRIVAGMFFYAHLDFHEEHTMKLERFSFYDLLYQSNDLIRMKNVEFGKFE